MADLDNTEKGSDTVTINLLHQNASYDKRCM